MKGPARCNLNLSNIAREHGALANYACSSFSEHVFQASSQDDNTLVNLRRFLGSPKVLRGIEYVAGHSDLNCLIRTANALKNFLQRRLKYLSPFGKDIVLVDSWATDLVQIVTEFGKILIVSPSSIYYLIPPFCPADTATRKYIAAPNRGGISVVGLTSAHWDDCLSTFGDPQETFSAPASSDKFFVVGTSGGKIVIYNETTFQEALKIQHQEAVTFLEFGRITEFLGSAGSRRVCLCDTSF